MFALLLHWWPRYEWLRRRRSGRRSVCSSGCSWSRLQLPPLAGVLARYRVCGSAQATPRDDPGDACPASSTRTPCYRGTRVLHAFLASPSWLASARGGPCGGWLGREIREPDIVVIRKSVVPVLARKYSQSSPATRSVRSIATECTLQMLKQKSLTKAGERATSAEDCRRVSVGVSVQQYSVQCKGYNLIEVTTVEASETRGATALVYWLINSSLYTGSVHCMYCAVWWSTVHPDWFDGQQGCRQLST